MYREAFGFDWKRLSEEAALKRMYALGVAAILDERHPEEYKRLMRQASTAYQRSVLELSFKEGQQRARNNRREFESTEQVWDALVESADATPPSSTRADIDGRTPAGSVPDAVTRAELLENHVDDLERIRLPKLLRRDS